MQTGDWATALFKLALGAGQGWRCRGSEPVLRRQPAIFWGVKRFRMPSPSGHLGQPTPTGVTYK